MYKEGPSTEKRSTGKAAVGNSLWKGQIPPKQQPSGAWGITRGQELPAKLRTRPTPPKSSREGVTPSLLTVNRQGQRRGQKGMNQRWAWATTAANTPPAQQLLPIALHFSPPWGLLDQASTERVKQKYIQPKSISKIFVLFILFRCAKKSLVECFIFLPQIGC